MTAARRNLDYLRRLLAAGEAPEAHRERMRSTIEQAAAEPRRPRPLETYRPGCNPWPWVGREGRSE